MHVAIAEVLLAAGAKDDVVAREVGDKVQAKSVSGKWWPATITYVHANGDVDVDVDDGCSTQWSRMSPAMVRVAPVSRSYTSRTTW